MMLPREPVDEEGARHLVQGLAIPDVPLPSTTGGTVNLGAQSGMAVVYFYPWTGRPGVADPPCWDDIPGAHGSTPQAEGFRDRYLAFREKEVAVFGVSTQGSEHQCELAERLNIPFEILSDEAFQLQQALNLPTFETGGVAYLRRLTLIVRDGRIEHVYYPVLTPADHAIEVLGWFT